MTLEAGSLRRLVVTPLVVGVLLVSGTQTTEAAGTPEQQCLNGRYAAAARYAGCQQKALGKVFGGGSVDVKFEAVLSKCRVTYTDTWATLKARATGTGATCDAARFEDNGDGTVTDRLTGLQWEKKTDDASVHDKDDFYSWSATPPAADGTAFTGLLTILNSAECLAGQCDWRLPTLAELQSILTEPYPCTTSPCVDQTVFGSTAAEGYWSATSNASSGPASAWLVGLLGGSGRRLKGSTGHVRAVRGGL